MPTNLRGGGRRRLTLVRDVSDTGGGASVDWLKEKHHAASFVGPVS